MFLLVDKQRMVIVHRHESNVTLSKIVHIEMPHCPSCIFEESHEMNWAQFSPLELMLIYEGLTDLKYVGHAIRPLISLLTRLSRTIEPSNIDGFEATLQANAIPFSDKGFYRYVHGSNKAKELDDIFVGVARKGSLTQAVALPLPTPANPPQSHVVAPAPWRPVAPTAPQKYPPPWA